METAAIGEAGSPPIVINPVWDVDGESGAVPPTVEASKSGRKRAPKKTGFECPVVRPNLSTGGLRLMHAIAVREPTDEAVAVLECWRFNADIRWTSDPSAGGSRLMTAPLLSTLRLTAEEVEGNCQWEPLRGAGAGYAAIGTPLDKEQRQQKKGRNSQPWLVARPDMSLEAAYAQGIHSDDFLHWVRYQAGTTFLRNFFPSDQRRDQLISDVLYAVLRTDVDRSIQNPRAWLKKIIRRKFADLLNRKNRIESREKMVDTHELRDCSTDPSEGQSEEPVDDLAEFPDDMKQIIRLKLMGYTVEEIANRLGFGQEAIQKRFRRYVAEIKSSKMSDFDANCGPKLM